MKKLRNHLTKEELDAIKGHRERLRKRYVTQNEDYMDTTRLLELLLTFSIPRQDVYLLANSLLSKFGSISGVLDASVDELMLVDGIGETTAILISLVSSLNRKKLISEITSKTFESTDQLARDVCTLFYGSKEEKILAVTLNSSMRIVSHEFISSGSSEECVIDNRKLARLILNDNVANIIIAHNHPNGNVYPSSEDMSVMRELSGFFESMSVKLIDMLIVSGNSYFKISDATKLSDKLSELLDGESSYIYNGQNTPESNDLAASLIEKRNK